MIRTDCSFLLAAFASSDKSKLLQKGENIIFSIMQVEGNSNVMKVFSIHTYMFLFIKRAIQKISNTR